MKIAILGTGGVGGYFGALLARADHDVTFIARGPHLLAIKKHGLSIKSPHGDFVIRPGQTFAAVELRYSGVDGAFLGIGFQVDIAGYGHSGQDSQNNQNRDNFDQGETLLVS